MTDRTTKTLLLLLVLGVWGLLFRSVFVATPIHAEEANPPATGLVVSGDDVYFHVGGDLYRFDRNLKSVTQNFHGTDGSGHYTY